MPHTMMEEVEAEIPMKEDPEFYYERNYAGHGRGVVITQDGGVFSERPMTEAELTARAPALAIASDIHKLACYAAFAYIKVWELIAPVIEQAKKTAREEALEETANIVLAMPDSLKNHFNLEGDCTGQSTSPPTRAEIAICIRSLRSNAGEGG